MIENLLLSWVLGDPGELVRLEHFSKGSRLVGLLCVALVARDLGQAMHDLKQRQLIEQIERLEALLAETEAPQVEDRDLSRRR